MKIYVNPICEMLFLDPQADLLTASGELTVQKSGGGAVWDLSDLSI